MNSITIACLSHQLFACCFNCNLLAVQISVARHFDELTENGILTFFVCHRCHHNVFDQRQHRSKFQCRHKVGDRFGLPQRVWYPKGGDVGTVMMKYVLVVCILSCCINNITWQRQTFELTRRKHTRTNSPVFAISRRKFVFPCGRAKITPGVCLKTKHPPGVVS